MSRRLARSVDRSQFSDNANVSFSLVTKLLLKCYLSRIDEHNSEEEEDEEEKEGDPLLKVSSLSKVLSTKCQTPSSLFFGKFLSYFLTGSKTRGRLKL